VLAGCVIICQAPKFVRWRPLPELPEVLVDHPHRGVRRVRLNRAARRNALDQPTVRMLTAAFAEASESVVILGSTDPAVFCAGADLSLRDQERAVLSDQLYGLYELMVTMPIPIIAAWDGPAVGGGAQLALAADVRIVGPAARLRFIGLGHGLALAGWALPGLVGRGRALDWALSMRWVEAPEAWQAGLVNKPVEQPAAAALEAATAFCALDPAAVARLKRAVNDSSLPDRLRRERRENAAWTGSMSPPASPGLADG
jgi:enoyl-CoA hydratase